MLGSLIPIAASSSSGSSSGGSAGILIFLVVMLGFFYFVLIRPQQRRAKQQRSLIESVDVGDEVMTIGGVYGTVRGMDDEAFTVEVAPGVDLRIVRSAIARKLVYDEPDESEPDEPEEHEDHEDQEAGEQS